MAFLQIPISIDQGGTLNRSQSNEEYLQSRLRFFLLSGAGRYLQLPTPGISSLWLILSSVGQTSKFCDRDILSETSKNTLENYIRDELNTWLDDSGLIEKVTILGDENNDNGILFRTEEAEYYFYFEFKIVGRGLAKGSIGNWNIRESVNVIY